MSFTTPKLWLPLAAVLMLSSCIEVEDFAAYWEKGIVDPALAGTWQKLGLPGEEMNNIPGADTLIFTRDGASYSLQSTNPIDPSMTADEIAQARKDNAMVAPVRIIKAGASMFMMIKMPSPTGQGTLERYVIKGNVLTQYSVDADQVLEDMERKHPATKSIGKNTGEGTYLVIHTFDDEVFRILSEIPATPEYWAEICRYRKTR